MEKHYGDQVVPSEGAPTLFVLCPGNTNCVPYRRPAQFPLVQSRWLTLAQNAAHLPPCPGRFAAKEVCPSDHCSESASYDTSLYSLPRPANRPNSTFHSSKGSLKGQPGSVPLEFPCDLESSFHTGLLSSTYSGTTCTTPRVEDSTLVGGTCATVPTISNDSDSTTETEDPENGFYPVRTPSDKYSSPHSIPRQVSGSTLPVLFHPRTKTIKRRRLASSRR